MLDANGADATRPAGLRAAIAAIDAAEAQATMQGTVITDLSNLAAEVSAVSAGSPIVFVAAPSQAVTAGLYLGAIPALKFWRRPAWPMAKCSPLPATHWSPQLIRCRASACRTKRCWFSTIRHPAISKSMPQRACSQCSKPIAGVCASSCKFHGHCATQPGWRGRRSHGDVNASSQRKSLRRARTYQHHRGRSRRTSSTQN